MTTSLPASALRVLKQDSVAWAIGLGIGVSTTFITTQYLLSADPIPHKSSRLFYVMMDNSKARIQEGKRGRGAVKRTKQKGLQERFNVAVHGPSLVKEVGDDKASRGESDWRDVRAVLIYQEKDVAQCSKDRRQILKRRVLAHVGTQDQWLQLLHLAFYEEGVYVAEEVVVVADGGAGIWEAISELLPSTSQRRVVQILDWCHAVSHLRAVTKKWKRGTRYQHHVATLMSLGLGVLG